MADSNHQRMISSLARQQGQDVGVGAVRNLEYQQDMGKVSHDKRCSRLEIRVARAMIDRDVLL